MTNGTLCVWRRCEGPWQNIEIWRAGDENGLIYLSSISSSVPSKFSLEPVLSFRLPCLLFHRLCVPCSPQFTGFPGHIVASQRKLAQHSAINNWRVPTWPGTLSLNGLFWERSMLACEGFIRTCRWNVQGHCQWSPLYVLILSRSGVTFSTPPPSPRLLL